jgi:formylmethanofuran dehydrogenase subunit E
MEHAMRRGVAAVVLILLGSAFNVGTRAETPDEWVALGARVHGGFGAFIPLGIRIGLDALDRLHAKPREVSVAYYDSDKSPCACFADGIAIATLASVGQRTLKVESENAPDGAAAVVTIRPRQGGAGVKYTIPLTALPELAKMNRELDPRGRYDAVMKADGLFEALPIN